MGVENIARGLQKANKLLRDNPETAKKAWGQGVCGFLIKKGVLKPDEIATCNNNIASAQMKAPPVPRSNIKSENNWKGGAPTQAAWSSYGQQGGQYSKTEEGKVRIAEGQKVFAMTGKSKEVRKRQLWGNQ